MESENDDTQIIIQQSNNTILNETNSIENVQHNTEKAIAAEKKRKLIFLEPAILLIFFAMNLSGAVYQNQVIYQTCTSVFKFNASDCANLGTSHVTDKSQKIEIQVQPYAAKIFMTSTLLQSLIPSIISLFIGSWSDKFGRKPVILSSFVGYFLFYVFACIIGFLSLKYVINPWFYILGIIPISISGGTCALITGTFCYIADCTTSKNRAYRMVLIEACIFIGLMCGSLSSSYLLYATNSVIVLFTSAITMLLAIIYTIIFVDESLRADQIQRGPKIRELFQWISVKDMFKTCFEKRPNYDRAIIWLTISSLGIAIFVMEGNSTVFYLFVREKFEWTVKDYTIYDSISIIIQIFGNIIGSYLLQKLLGFSITSLALIAYGSSVIDSVIKLTAVYPWHLYLSISAGILRGISGPMCRAILSNVVPVSDIGKLYSFTTSIETISPLASAPLYAYVYSSTILTYPGLFNGITTFMYFICYIFIAIIYGIQKSFPTTTYAKIG